MTKPTSISVVRSVQLGAELGQLRSHAALVRALLEEIERIVPSPSGSGEPALSGQLSEELARLGHRLLECAATMTRPSERPPRLDSDSDERARNRLTSER